MKANFWVYVWIFRVWGHFRQFRVLVPTHHAPCNSICCDKCVIFCCFFFVYVANQVADWMCMARARRPNVMHFYNEGFVSCTLFHSGTQERLYNTVIFCSATKQLLTYSENGENSMGREM